MSSEEADLLNLLSVAARMAGDASRADAACARAGATRNPRVHFDRLCRAYAAGAAGNRDAAARILAGYVPPAPEHEAIARALLPPG